MFDSILFMGIPLSNVYQQKIKQLSTAERELFIQNQTSIYLQQIEKEGIWYLGKEIGSVIEMAALESMQLHIYSLLKKLMPSFTYMDHPLLILALPL